MLSTKETFRPACREWKGQWKGQLQIADFKRYLHKSGVFLPSTMRPHKAEVLIRPPRSRRSFYSPSLLIFAAILFAVQSAIIHITNQLSPTNLLLSDSFLIMQFPSLSLLASLFVMAYIQSATAYPQGEPAE